MRRMPPDFGCCATASVGTATAMATAKLKSLVFILSLPVTRVGSPDRPAVVLGWRHASRCGEAGQPGRRAKGCGLSAPSMGGMAAFRRPRLAKPAAFAHTLRLRNQQEAP